jgi:peptidoglycan/LPS O-acetylase OafA/YrhL
LSLSAIKKDKRNMFKTALVFLAVSLFCVIFSLVYATYSHGVYSSYMTFMFAYPLIGGMMVYLLIGAVSRLRMPGRFIINVYNSGIAALTVGSLLKGIFDIAGTSSPYQPVLVVAGVAMVLAGTICYLVSQFKRLKITE